MICEDKKTNDNWTKISPATICCRWFCPPLHLIPVWLISPFPIITKKLSNIFLNTEMVHRSVLQWTREERVSLSLYERTFFAVLHFHFMTAFQRRPKRRRVFPFPNNRRRPSKVLTTLFLTFFSTFSIRPSIFFFLFLQCLSSLFVLLLVYGLAFPHFSTAQQVTNVAGFGVRIG